MVASINVKGLFLKRAFRRIGTLRRYKLVYDRSPFQKKSRPLELGKPLFHLFLSKNRFFLRCSYSETFALQLRKVRTVRPSLLTKKALSREVYLKKEAP